MRLVPLNRVRLYVVAGRCRLSAFWSEFRARLCLDSSPARGLFRHSGKGHGRITVAFDSFTENSLASENTNAIEYDDDAVFRAFQQEAEAAFEALAEFAIPLSDKDKVLVSEAWNRFLSAPEVFLEAVALRWLWVTQPEGNLQRALDTRVHDLRELLLGVLDLAVRSLNPDLQEIHHEAYRAVHPDARRECQSLTEYLRLFSELGVRPLWWVELIEVVRWASAIYFSSKREVETEDLDNGQTASALKRFIAVQVAQPAIRDALEMRVGYKAAVFGEAGLLGHWRERFGTDAERATLGQKFYRLLFDRHPGPLDYFKTADMDRLSLHVIQSVELVLTGARDIGEFEFNSRNALRCLAHIHRELLIPTWTYPLIGLVMVDLVGFEDRGAISKAAMIDAFTRVYGYVVRMMTHPMIREERLIREAETWFDLLAKEWRWSPEKLQQRMLEVKLEVSATGMYTHTSEELQTARRWRGAIQPSASGAFRGIPWSSATAGMSMSPLKCSTRSSSTSSWPQAEPTYYRS